MKKILLSILTITAFNTAINAQNHTSAFLAREAIGAPINIPSSYASVQTLTGSNLRLTGDWTIEAWVKVVLSAGQNHIIETYSTTGSNGGFALRLSGSKIQAHQITNQSSSSTSVTGATVIPDGEWHHVAATLNETTDELKVYLDGVLDGTSTTTLNTLNNNVGLYIGARGDDQNVNGEMEMDNVRIWNKAKTEAEIQADTLACLTGSETDLLAWYDFEGVTTSTLTDKSVHGNHGTFQNYSISNITNRAYTCIPVTNTGVEENEKEKFSLYPNPATSQLIINTTERIIKVNVIDITGKTIASINPSKNIIDVSDLVNGIYFLQINTENGITNSKFIKE